MPSKEQRKKAKRKESNSKYYQKNRDSLRKKQQEYHSADREERKAACKEYYNSHIIERKASFSEYYNSHIIERKASFSEYNKAHREELKAASSEYNKAHREELKAACSQYNESHRDELKAACSQYNKSHRDELKAACSQYNKSHRDELKAACSEYNRSHRDELKTAFRKHYSAHAAERKASFKQYYKSHSKEIKAARKQYYAAHKNKERATSRAYKLKNARTILKRARKYYAEHKEQCCADRRRRYRLAEPKPNVKHQYIKEVTMKLMTDAKSTKDMLCAFRNQYEDVAMEMTKATSKRAASSITATRLVNKVLQVRKFFAGTLLKAVRSITKMSISDASDLGEGLHCTHSEPYFYECAYTFNDRPDILSVDELGQCRPVVAGIIEGKGENVVPQSWKCSSKCKSLPESEVASILEFKSGFEGSMGEIRKFLDTCDECPNTHYSKVMFAPDADPESNLVHHSVVERMGHKLALLHR